jgi:flavin reductase (DIM6/NTAB) family NADH-FMN oxidoreductase RutF
VNLAPYSVCFPHLSPEGHQMELVARASSKTAANLVRTGRLSINFIPDKPEYLACCRELSKPVPTQEKMARSIFTFIPSELPAAQGKAIPPLVAESVQAFECKLLRVAAWGEEDQRFLLEVENVRMQRYWARSLESGRSGPRLPVDYGFRKGASTWMSRPEVVALGPRLRPQYVIEAARPPERVIDDLRAALQQPDADVTGKIRGNALQLNIPEHELNTWSPSMELSVEPSATGSTIYARIGPLPQVWTTFMFVHLLIAMGGLGGLVWGSTQLFLGGRLWAFWVPLAALFLHAFVAGAAFIGQGLSADQIYRLRTFLSDAIGP